jgi:hypothetical protein
VLLLDFMFLGAVGKKLFADNVGDMMASRRMAPTILFFVLYLTGVVIFVNGSAPSDRMHNLQYGAVRRVLLSYVRTHQHGSTQWGNRRAGYRLGRGADGGFPAAVGGLIAGWILAKIQSISVSTRISDVVMSAAEVGIGCGLTSVSVGWAADAARGAVAASPTAAAA